MCASLLIVYAVASKMFVQGRLQFLFQELGGDALAALCHLFGGACHHDGAAFASSFGSHVDDVVGEFDDIEVVFDDNDGIALVHQSVEDIHQDADIFEVKPGSWLVKDINSLACIALGQFCSQFYTLAFPS